jgi:hypothetical protein
VTTKHGARRMADRRLLHGRKYNVQITICGIVKILKYNTKLYITYNIYQIVPTIAILETFSDLLVFSISEGNENDSALEQSSVHCQWWLCKVGLSLLET